MPSSINILNSFFTTSRASFEPVVTERNSILFTSLITSRMASPSPGGMSMTRKSRSFHRVIARNSIRALEMSDPLRGEGLWPVEIDKGHEPDPVHLGWDNPVQFLRKTPFYPQ